MLSNALTTSRIMRFVYEFDSKVVYINSFDSYYRFDEQAKEIQKRRVDITSKIEIYTLLKSDQFLPKENPKMNLVVSNNMQYCFEGNSIKMINLSSK